MSNLLTENVFNETELQAKIPGWGTDSIKANRVGVPKEEPSMKPTGVHWTKAPQQIPKVKINLSASRSSMTPVMGTMQPPKGLSGIIRNYAYTFTEVRPTHWMLLIMADRIDVVESKISEFIYGRADEEGKVSSSPRPAVVIAGVGLLAMGAIYLIHRQGQKAKSPDVLAPKKPKVAKAKTALQKTAKKQIEQNPSHH